MWKNYAVRYIKENRISSIFLSAITLVAAALLSIICGILYNLWADYVVRQQIANEGTLDVKSVAILYGALVAVVCTALVAMIHNAFAVSMNNRLHQLGILQSVGATSKQIRIFLLEEAAVLCMIPAFVGVLLGILGSYGFMQLIIVVTESVRKYDVIFRYHPLVAVGALGLTFLTILISAWLPAEKVSRLAPLEAIHYGEMVQEVKVRRFRIFSKMFGVYGELACRSLGARKKELRTTAISLALSFLAFITFVSLEIVSGINTQRTYFERYADVWDLHLTRECVMEADMLLAQIRELDGVENCTAYQKAQTVAYLSEGMLSDEVSEVGLEHLQEGMAKDAAGTYQMNVWLYILDDASYETYCGAESTDKGAIVVNKIWDSVHSDWSNRVYLPLLKEQMGEITLTSSEDKINQANAEKAVDGKESKSDENTINIFGYATEMPAIREEFKQSGITLILSETYYKHLMASTNGQINDTSAKCYYNILRERMSMVGTTQEGYELSEEKISLELTKEEMVKKQVETLLTEDVSYTIEGRLEEEKSDIDMRRGFKIVVGTMASLFAAIGIANVFSSTLGQIYQRKKEFARYLSVGMSPVGMKKIFCMEAFVIALRPLGLSLLFDVPVVLMALQATSISLTEFMQKMPWLIILYFFIAILLFIGLAYYLAGTRICKEKNLIEVLKDETMI